MSAPRTILTAPPNSGTAHLGHTLVDLVDDALAKHPNATALNQWDEAAGFQPVSTAEYVRGAEEAALGLLALGLNQGDRAALFMHSDVTFCDLDLATLLAGLPNVPIYLTHAPEAIGYVIGHTQARLLAVSDADLLRQLVPLLGDLPDVEHVVVARGAVPDDVTLPDGVAAHTWDAVRALGRAKLEAAPKAAAALRKQIQPGDLATIIYTSGTTGTPKGVMLTHENIAYNTLTSYSGLADLGYGPDEVTLSFLPMTHVFQRTLHFGAMSYGHSIYFVEALRAGEFFPQVQPTIFATVPRVLEKVYEKIVVKSVQLTGPRKWIANRALELARQYEIGQTPTGWYAMQLKVADKLVFSKWREALGGRVKYVICGGAALSPLLANVFAAAGVTILQGYGLTETSPVITYNRPDRNRAGTVGVPLPEVEVGLAEDGEIVTRGPHVMQGYYREPEKTAAVIDDDGWFHTGDIGEITDEGFLKITDRKKDLFKLSTGKYVTPQPVENVLNAEPLVEQAVVVGAGEKYCTALIFPNQDSLRVFARLKKIPADLPIDDLLDHPAVAERFIDMVKQANADVDPWSRIKRFTLVPEHLTIDNGMLTPTMKVRRSALRARYQPIVAGLYAYPHDRVTLQSPNGHAADSTAVTFAPHRRLTPEA